MLKLKELRLAGVGRFVEEQVIDFTKLGNLVQIDGQNLNTNGSSGAGKSTLFKALDYLFGVNDIPETVLQSRLTEDAMSVTGTFELDGKPLVIKRGKKLSVEFDGELTVGSNKLAEEKIDKILGLPRDRFRPMLHKRQGEGGFFLNFTPKKTYEFLTDCLNLGDAQKKADRVDEKIKELENVVATAKIQIGASEAALKATQDALAALGKPPVKEVTQETVLALKAKMEASAAVLATLKTQHKLELEQLELTRPQISITPYDLTKKESLDKELAEVRKFAQKLQQDERDRQTQVSSLLTNLRLLKSDLEAKIRAGTKASQEALTIASEIKKIRESICPTCEQGWGTEKAKEREAELLNKLTVLKETITEGKSSEQKIVEVEGKLANLTAELAPKVIEGLRPLSERETEILASIQFENQSYRDHQATENAKNKVVLDAFASRQRELQAKQSAESEQASGQFDLDRRTFDGAVQKMKSYEEAKTRYENTAKNLANQEHASKEVLRGAQNALATATENLEICQEIKRAIKTYISYSFDGALEEISETATRIIRGIANMANATIQLQGVKETKEGKVKEEVNAVINLDGEVGIPIKSLSGGERSSVDLAVDLAVIELLENKTNKGIDVFILDEPFTGLDTVSIEMALEVLKNSNLTKRLVIVDHNPEVKQMVESRLVVVRDGATSKVVQQ